MDNNRYCVIMAGGSGNKFWPVSRESKPKQFLNIAETDYSLIKMTFDRFARLIPKERILVVTLAKYKDIVMEQLPELLPENLLLEPYSRNTAPCIAFAAYAILKRDPEAVMVVSPSDHIILDTEKFTYSINTALEYADRMNALMTIGIVPTKPETDYGYIQVTGKPNEKGNPCKVKTFTEKPDEELANVFFNSGEFYWNSGIFAWKASVIIEEMKKYVPDMISLFNGWETSLGDENEKDFLDKVYSECPKISVDHGVMEKTDNAWLLPGPFGWSDLNGWDVLCKLIRKQDSKGNIVITKERIMQDTSDSIIISGNDKKLYVLKGLKNFIVVDTEDALMICPRGDEEYKDIISDLGMPDFEEYR